MHIDDLFYSPKRSLAVFTQVRLHLYRREITMQDYFLPLRLDTLTGLRVKSSEHHTPSRLISLAIRGADKVGQFRPRRKIKTCRCAA